MPSDILNLTVAQAIAWLVAFGIAAGVAYGLSFFPQLDPKIRGAIQAVVVAMLVAGVNAIVSFIPQNFLDMKLLDAMFALVTFLLGLAGTAFGLVKGATHRVALAEARAKLAASK